MVERGRGYCGGRGGGRREDPLDDEGQHQRDLRDVKNDDLRREVRALRRRIARLEASRDRDFNFVVHYEDDDKNDNPFARAGGERRFRHRVADPGRDFGVRLEIPEFTGKVLPVVEIEGPPVYDEYPDEGVESEFEVVLETVDDNNFTTEVKYASLKSLNICRLGNETGDNLNFAVEAVRATSEHNDNLSTKLLDVEQSKELKVIHFDAPFKKSVIADFVSGQKVLMSTFNGDSASLVFESMAYNQILLLVTLNYSDMIPTLIKIEVEKLMADYFGVAKDGPKVYGYARNHNPKYYLIDGKITLKGIIVSGRHCSMLLLCRPTW
ncbi:Thioredoxin-like domain [Castilleja foliolosa]|uniref:Thioredoxin-like domain n=1 Tax=Castilleja foliolosa TaxID=1961234 RepID=A0ABD3D3G3_9LAMI